MTRMAPLLLRADADLPQGTGPWARLLTLAPAWRAQGGRVLFLGNIASPAAREQIGQAGVEFVYVDRRHPHPGDLSAVAQCFHQLRREAGPQAAVWTALSGNHFDVEYQSALRALGGRLLVVDDLAAARHYDADLLLNANPGVDERHYAGCVDYDTTLLLGPRYALAAPTQTMDRPEPAAVANAGRVLLDGAGPARVTAVMHALDGDVATEDVVLRPLEPTDCWPLWRTTPGRSLHPRGHATDPLPPDAHRRWFGEKLAPAASRIWVLALHGLILGVIRYDRVGDGAAEISFHVVRSCRCRGLGARLVAETCEWARRELAVERLRAVVRNDNEASARVFLRNGFAEASRCTLQGRECRILEQAGAAAPKESQTARLLQPAVAAAVAVTAALPVVPMAPTASIAPAMEMECP